MALTADDLEKRSLLERTLRGVVSLLLSGLLFYHVLLPLQGVIGLNLAAVAEPYFLYEYYYRALQILLIFGVRYLFLPFFLAIGYRLFHRLLARFFPGRLRWTERGLGARASEFLAAAGRPRSWPGAGRLGRLQPSFGRVASLLGRCLAPFGRAWRAVAGFLTAPGARTNTFLRARAPLFLRRRWRRIAPAIPPLRRLPRHAYFGFCWFVVILEIAFGIDLAVNIASRPTAARALFNNCGQCHGLNRPFNFNHTAAIWNFTLDRMYGHAPDMGKSLPLDQREGLHDLLVSIRGYSDRRLIRSKCYVCHLPWGFSREPRTVEEWDRLLERIQRRNTYHITERQRDQLAAYLTRQSDLIAARPTPPWDPEQKSRFEAKCAVCHTLDVIFVPQGAEADWPAILDRMGLKQPDFLTAEEGRSLQPLIDAALVSEKRFLRSFPHSRMREREP